MIVGGPSPRQLIQKRQDARAWRLQRDLDAADEARRQVLRAAAAHDIFPHTPDQDDPWAEPVLRPCEVGCQQHPKAI